MAAKIIDFDKEGRYLYKGFLTSKELQEYEEVKDRLINEIPALEEEIKEKYWKENRILYFYFLGKTLGAFLEEFNVSVKERRRFWDEIKTLATSQVHTRSDGKVKKRSFFEQCYRLSCMDQKIVESKTWRQWQSLLDRDDKNIEDSRFINWVGKTVISEDEWRELLKIMNFYLDEIDTTVFEDNEIYALYDSMLSMSKVWLKSIKQFEKNHPKSLKLQKKSKWSIKFYKACVDSMTTDYSVDKDRLIILFDEVMC